MNFQPTKNKITVIFTSAIVVFAGMSFFMIRPAKASSDLAAIVAGSGSDINLSSGDYTFTGDLTIPAGKTLHYDRGAIIHISAGQTLFINGEMEDQLYQIFDDQNTGLGKGVKFAAGNVLDVRPEWWGASASAGADYVNWDAVHANSDALDHAVNSHPDFHTNILLLYGTYNINRKMVLKGSTSLIGTGKTAFRPSYWMNDIVLEDSPLVSEEQTSTLSGIDFYNVNGKDNISLTNGSKNWHISKCSFRWGGAWMVNINGVNNVKIEDSYIISRSKGAINVSNASDIDIEYNDIDNASAQAGVKFNNCTNCLFDGNIVFGGQSQAGDTSWFSDQSVLVTGTNSLKITRNRFDMAKNGLVIDGSGVDVEDNLMVALSLNGIYSNGSFDNIIVKDNKIKGSEKYDPNFSVIALNYGVNIGSISNSSIIKDNLIELWKLGAINFTANPTLGDYPLIEDNQGVDVTALDFPTLEASATPPVTISRNWKTANFSPVTLSDFTKAPIDKEIFILFGDNNTTVKFSGSSKLQGNGGMDWKPAKGDHLFCTKQSSGSWNCDVGNDTGLARSIAQLADINQDSKIDTTDLAILKTDFLRLTVDLANPRSDINGDGQATVKDVGIMMSQWAP